jgi:hypothetical protein
MGDAAIPAGISMTDEVWIGTLIDPIMFHPAATSTVSAILCPPASERVSAAASFNQYPAPLASVSFATYPPSNANACVSADGNRLLLSYDDMEFGTETIFHPERYDIEVPPPPSGWPGSDAEKRASDEHPGACRR